MIEVIAVPRTPHHRPASVIINDAAKDASAGALDGVGDVISAEQCALTELSIRNVASADWVAAYDA